MSQFGKTSEFSIGLSMVKGIIKLHKGTLQIDSKIGIGTVVKVGFPIAEP